MNIIIPHNWSPRAYQLPVFKAFDSGCKRFVLIYHRRAGKDDVCLHIGAKAVLTRVGNYWHMLPEYSQGRKAIWDAVNSHTGKRRIDEAFPLEIRKRTNNQEMFIEFINGSTWQVVGSDRFDSTVGAAPVGIVFSEFALSNPLSWDYLSPILEENGGFAFFISTVRGKNHFWTLGEYAKDAPDWYYQKVDADQSGVFTPAQLQNILEQYQARRGDDEGLAIFRQEYYNDPSAGMPGAYYAKLLVDAEKDNRVTNVPYDPMLPVTTGWDLGTNDPTCIWFAQQVSKEIRLIDYYENNNQGLEHYIKILKSKPYVYYKHIFPHDIAVTELSSGLTRLDTLHSLGIFEKDIIKIPNNPGCIEDRINAVRVTLPRCWFDKEKTKRGRDGLSSYRSEYDEKRQVFRSSPLHDWASDPSDSFGYLCQGIRPIKDTSKRPREAQMDYATFG